MAREIALRQLTVRARSRAELATALASRQVPEETAEQVLDRLEEVGLVDDRSFAAQWVGARHRQRGLSRRAIRQELRTKGVDDDAAAEALEAIGADEELSAARSIAEKKLRTLAGQPREVVRRRLAGALGRRGYGSAVVSRVLADIGDGDGLYLDSGES